MTLKAMLTVHEQHTNSLADILLTTCGESLEIDGNNDHKEPISTVQFDNICSIKEVSPLLHQLKNNGISHSFQWEDNDNSEFSGESHYRRDADGVDQQKEWTGYSKNVINIEDVRRTLTEEGEIGLNELLDSIEDSYDVLDWTKIAI